jgi:elongation factor G
MQRDLKRLRNIGVIAHIDAGKTTVTERMLFYCGATHRMGDVDKGTTVTDFDPEEQQRGITISAACVTFSWKDFAINLIDTPGHVDFTAEVERSLRVLDGGVVVFSAREGVEAQSETVWHQADRYEVPRIAFINKMDREGAEFERTLDDIRTRLASQPEMAQPLAIQIPVGAGPSHAQDPFRGIIDLIEMRYLTFTGESKGAEIHESPIPEELREEAELWRSEMLEKLFNVSDELANLIISDEPIPPRMLRDVLRGATLHRLLVPVLCGSALHHIGVQPLLDAVGHYLPSPFDIPPVEGLDLKSEKKLTRPPDPEAPFCGLVFKIDVDQHGDICYVRVYSGRLKEQSRALNAGKNKKENISQLWHIQADRREKVPMVEAGDIVGLVGLRHSVTGDTLCDTQHPILLESIRFPETVISMAIEPESTAERKKLAGVLELMKRQDPTFRAQENEETGQTLISGMGELHLEIIKNRLLRDFNVDVRVHKPRVSYRESISRAVEATGECHRQIAGQELFAKVRVRLEPNRESEAVELDVEPLAREQLGDTYTGVVQEVLREEGASGGIFGFPMIRMKITLLGGEVHDTDSNEVAFRHAAADAVHRGLREADTILLEPIMKLEITTPEAYLGEFVADLQQRRAVIHQTQTRSGTTIIEAEAPLAQLFGYSNAMRGLSQGRASCSMEPSSYSAAPEEVSANFR